jgi:hypothetical protein
MRFAQSEREIVSGVRFLARRRETGGLGFDHREGALGDKCKRGQQREHDAESAEDADSNRDILQGDDRT